MKKRESKSVWRDRIRRYETSELTAAAFCRSEGVAHSSFYQWRRRIIDDVSEPLSFVEVTTATPSSSRFELVLPSGVVLRVNGDYEAGPLRRLVADLVSVE